MAVLDINDTCIGCEICIGACPTDVLRMHYEPKLAYIAYVDDCQICHLCRLSCPVEGCITITPDKGDTPFVTWR